MWGNRKGISPIVGVILVVAMTVLLAAIAWTYLSGMTSNPGKVYQVAVKAQRVANGTSYSDIIVTYIGGPDQSKVTQLCVNFIGANSSNITANPSVTPSGTVICWNTPSVGATAKTWISRDKKVHVVVNATFSDGTQQVLYDSVI
ncbi:archaellin/type IV pilin N-terminal domain-containing protein [Archaeoglobus sp.]